MDISSYFKYALRLWQFDESAAQELREQEASSIWMSLAIVVIFSFINFFSVTLISFMSGGLEENTLSIYNLMLYFIGYLIAILIISPLLWLLFIFMSYVWIKIFGGDLKFKKTFELFIIMLTPYLMFNTILVFIFSLSSVFFTEIIQSIIFYTFGLISLGIIFFVFVVIAKTTSITHNLDIVKTLLSGFLFICSVFFVIIPILVITSVLIGVAGSYLLM
ncbi:MAG: hypothetical protein ACLFPL_04345 [Candidatus Nanoarchaeia archaeon]